MSAGLLFVKTLLRYQPRHSRLEGCKRKCWENTVYVMAGKKKLKGG
jgi:hypothetical protein